MSIVFIKAGHHGRLVAGDIEQNRADPTAIHRSVIDAHEQDQRGCRTETQREGKDLQIGSDILVKAALGVSFADATGAYFDNDSGQFAQPHAAALDAGHSADVMQAIEEIVAKLTLTTNR